MERHQSGNEMEAKNLGWNSFRADKNIDIWVHFSFKLSSKPNSRIQCIAGQRQVLEEQWVYVSFSFLHSFLSPLVPCNAFTLMTSAPITALS